jgi:hypothetical protein
LAKITLSHARLAVARSFEQRIYGVIKASDGYNSTKLSERAPNRHKGANTSRQPITHLTCKHLFDNIRSKREPIVHNKIMNFLAKRSHVALNLITINFMFRTQIGIRLPKFNKLSNFRII